MNSRERLLGAIRHEPIDRVPVSTYELVGWNPDAWENNEPSYQKLMNAVREYTDCIYMLNPGQKTAPAAAIELKEWYHEHSHFTEKVYHTKMGDLSCLYREDEGVHTVWTIKHLLENIDDIHKYLSLPYEEPQLDMTHFYQQKKQLGDKGLMMISVGDPVCEAAELFEMSTFLVYAMTEPAKIKYFLDALHERQINNLANMLRYDVQDVIFRICGPEYCTPPYLSPKYYYDYVTGYLIKICRMIKDAGGIPRIHCHGKINKVMEQFMMTEAEAIDPIEPPPDGDMTLSDMKGLYGRKFCLFGNIELRELECANHERIDALVYQAFSDAKAESGFVLMPTAAPITVPLGKRAEENYLQMIESAIKYGAY